MKNDGQQTDAKSGPAQDLPGLTDLPFAQAEIATTERERFLAEVVEAAVMPFAVGVADGRLIMFNQAFADLTGYSREELQQRQLTWSTDLTPIEWRALEVTQLAEAVRTRMPVRYEKEYLRKDGTRVPIELFVQPAFDAEGRLQHYRCFLSNIAARKQAEVARQQAEEQYRSLFVTLLEGFCIIKVIFDSNNMPVDFRYLEVNPAFEKQTGLPAAQGKCVRELIPGLEAHWFEFYGKIARTGKPARCVNHVKELNRWYDVSAYRIGVPECGTIAVLFNDITAVKRTEAALREREKQLRLFVEQAPVSIAMFDAGMRYIAASQRWLADYGLAGQELQGRSHYEVFPEIPDRWKEIHRRCLAGAAEHCEEDPFVRADGRTQWLRWDVRPWHAETGTEGGIIIFAEDITKRKLVEQEVRQSQQLLQDIINNSQTLIYVKDLDGRIRIANQALGDALGMPPGEMVGKTSREIVSNPEHAEIHMANDQRVIETGQAFTLEENTPGHVYLSVKFPLRNVHGQITGIGGISTEITARKKVEDVLRFLGQSVASGSGEAFFTELAQYLAQALDVDYVCIARLTEDRLAAQTLAIIHDGKFDDPMTYTLKDTPCGDLVGKLIRCFPSHVRRRFANDPVLQELQAESYAGVSLWNAKGQAIGLIAVIGRQPLADLHLTESILQLVAVRASGELERQQAEEELRRHAAELERFNRAMVGRELRMIELKHEVNELCGKLGQKKAYPLEFEQA